MPNPSPLRSFNFAAACSIIALGRSDGTDEEIVDALIVQQRALGAAVVEVGALRVEVEALRAKLAALQPPALRFCIDCSSALYDTETDRCRDGCHYARTGEHDPHVIRTHVETIDGPGIPLYVVVAIVEGWRLTRRPIKSKVEAEQIAERFNGTDTRTVSVLFTDGQWTNRGRV